jgi:RelA/SpoT family protein
MKLTQTQDLGGCRGIVSSAEKVQQMAKYYQNESSIKHPIASNDDYISAPKQSGYRGIHLVFRYFSDKPNKKMYNDLKIEMQLRSRYQHAWATAVETVGMFSGQALKSSLGSVEWQRFFSLMGSVVAVRERCPAVPGTPPSKAELLSEVSHYADTLNVAARLKEYGRALSRLQRSVAKKKVAFYLLELDPTVGSLSISDSWGMNSRRRKTGIQRPKTEFNISLAPTRYWSRSIPSSLSSARIPITLLTHAFSFNCSCKHFPGAASGSAYRRCRSQRMARDSGIDGLLIRRLLRDRRL